MAAGRGEAAEPVDHLSGNLILNVDTNFMSYGLDVWQTGNFHDGAVPPAVRLEVGLRQRLQRLSAASGWT